MLAKLFNSLIFYLLTNNLGVVVLFASIILMCAHIHKCVCMCVHEYTCGCGGQRSVKGLVRSCPPWLYFFFFEIALTLQLGV